MQKVVYLAAILLAAKMSFGQVGVKAISAANPVFPREADNVIYGDTVSVIVGIDIQGRVTEAVAYGPLAPCSNLNDKTAAAIAKSAIDAAKSTVFEPLVKDGKRTAAAVRLTYRLPVKNPAPREDDPKKVKAITLEKPEFLTAAKNQRIDGEAKLSVLIDEHGKALSVGGREGHPLLIAGAIDAACRSRFVPPPAKYIGTVIYRFVL